MTVPHNPIYYITRLVPDYRVPILEEFNRRIGGRLVVCSGRAGGESLQTLMGRTADVSSIALRDFWLGGGRVHAQAFWQAFGVCSAPAAVIAEESPRTITLPLLLAYCKMRGIPVGLWGHFSSNDRPFGSPSLLDQYRLRLASTADVCITYTDRQADLLRPHLRHDRVFAARNTLDTRSLFTAYDQLAREGKAAVRTRLGLAPDSITIVYVGRLVEDKGVDILLDVVKRLQAAGSAQSIVIGDGPRRRALEARVLSEKIADIRFTGAINDMAESAPYVFASDVMLVPGFLGLQVNHAFSLGVPIVSRQAPSDARYHSPEVDYVRNGWNGILVEKPTAEHFAEAIRTISKDPTFSENALEFARSNLRLEYMIDGLERAVHALMKRKELMRAV